MAHDAAGADDGGPDHAVTARNDPVSVCGVKLGTAVAGAEQELVEAGQQ